MRLFATLLIVVSTTLCGQASDRAEAVNAVQKLFDAMAAHDGALIRSTMLPDARIYSIRNDGVPASRTAGDMAGQIAGIEGALLERFTSQPAVSIRGRMAQVWGEYEFLRDGKFTHCGVDSVGLFKTPEGWKIATLAYTVEPTGCKGHPHSF